MRLAAIGLVAGFFTALLGAGGGLLIVPLLVLVADFDQRRASGTSLAAIGATALTGTLAYGLHGEVKIGAAALLGIPAAFGAVAGTRLQQRLQARTLSFAFAALLVLLALRLAV